MKWVNDTSNISTALWYPANIYLFKDNNGNTTKRCEICSKFTIKITERRQWRRSIIFIVKFIFIKNYSGNGTLIKFSIRTLIASFNTINLMSCYRYWSNRSNWLLNVQSQQWKHQNNVWNLFKVNDKDTRTTLRILTGKKHPKIKLQR